MAKLLDFKHWTVSSHSEKSAQLKHKDGHTMFIAIKALPKIQREQLKRLGSTAAAGPVVQNFEGGGVATPPPSNSSIEQLLDRQKSDYDAVKQPQSPPPSEATAPSKGLMYPDQTINAPAAVGQQQQGIREQQAVDTQKSQAQVPIEQQGIQNEQEIQKQIADHYKDLKQHTDEFNAYQQQNPINPNAYQDSKTGGQKLDTAIGLLLGGIAGHGNGNVAMDFLNKQIDRNIDSQKKNFENRNTVWGAYEHLYNDGNVATNLTKVSMNDMLVHRAQMAAAQLGTPQAKATADALSSQKAIENTQLLEHTAGRLGTLKTTSSDNVGTSTGQSPGQPQAATGPDYGIKPILHANADTVFRGKQFDDTAKPNYTELSQQYTNAAQADKALKELGPLYQRLAHNRSLLGSIHRSISPGGHAGVGHGIVGDVANLAGKAVGPLTNTEEGRQFESDRSALLGLVSGALRGSPLGGSQIEEQIDSYLPAYNDSQEALLKKRKNLEEFIKIHTPTNQLKGMLNRE